MLLANVATAEHIFKSFPQCAMLRRHPAPPDSNYESLVRAVRDFFLCLLDFSVCLQARGYGIDLDTATSRTLAVSLDQASSTSHPYINTLLRILVRHGMIMLLPCSPHKKILRAPKRHPLTLQATRCMYQAVYFCSGSVTEAEFMHYGLAAPIYTHFTSPIRR